MAFNNRNSQSYPGWGFWDCSGTVGNLPFLPTSLPLSKIWHLCSTMKKLGKVIFFLAGFKIHEYHVTFFLISIFIRNQHFFPLYYYILTTSYSRPHFGVHKNCFDDWWRLVVKQIKTCWSFKKYQSRNPLS